MKTFYVVAKRFFNDGQGRTEGTFEILSPYKTLSSEALRGLRDASDKQIQENNPEITYDDTCMITFIHELED